MLYPGVALALLGSAVSYFGYLENYSSISPNEILGPAFFWIGVGLILFASLFRRAPAAFSRTVGRPAGFGAFAGYLAVHLVLYGFILDAILTFAYPQAASTLAQSYGFLVTTNVFLPPSLVSTAFDLAYNPAITIALPPFFGVALSFYGVAVAVIIAVLVVANIGKTTELGSLCTRARKARSYVVLPALGIVLGASCCISVAGLVTLAAPSVAALTSVAWIYYTTYLLFPALAMALLYVNLRSIERISAGIMASLEGPPSRELEPVAPAESGTPSP